MKGLSTISLRLARCREFPEGNLLFGYEITAPLDSEGRLDAKAWRELRDHCRVRRLLPNEATRHGKLVHRAGGAGGGTWVLDYDDRSDADDEDGFRLGDHRLAPGEYVSIKDADGNLRTYSVLAVRPA
jgi:hypothetical protein